MKVTLLEHATALVETGPMRILMDPVLQDPFENGMGVSCPNFDATAPIPSRRDLLSCGRDPRVNVVHWIAASALTGWIQHRLGWFTVRADSRRYPTLCAIARHASSVRVEAISLPDLPMHHTIYEAAGSEAAAKRRMDHESSKLRALRG